MSRLFVACELGQDLGRVVLGTLQPDALVLNEIRRFPNKPVSEKKSLFWDIAPLYEQMLEGLREVGRGGEQVASISCSSWGADYLLFDSRGALVTPAYHHADRRGEVGRKTFLKKLAPEKVYAETGIDLAPGNTLFQLEAETARRLRRARQLLPIADGFNFLLSGLAGVEHSSAATTQLFNPLTKIWSDALVQGLGLRAELLPALMPAGKILGKLRPELAKETRLEEANVVASCSYDLAAALAGLPIEPEENWGFLKLGASSLLGVRVEQPLINDLGRKLRLSNGLGFGETAFVSTETAGLYLLEACQRGWQQTETQLDVDMLTHLAGGIPAFESLIDPAHSRFTSAENILQEIKGFCKDTGQSLVEKPAAVYRCVVESLVMLYWKTLHAMEHVTGSGIQRLYLLNPPRNPFFAHLLANALRIPVVLLPTDTTAAGNIAVQAMALGHIKTVANAGMLLRNSVKTETIMPQPTSWEAVNERFLALCTAST